MKKILTHLTGFVLLITILVAGGCSSTSNNENPKDMGKVKIYCKAFEKNGAMHFEMYDSNDAKKVVANLTKDKLVANHTTDIMPGTKVIWMWVPDSEIQKFVKIGPQTPGEIITRKARKILFTKKLKLKIPRKAPPDKTEKYDIIFVGLDGDTVTIDPYLRIR